MTHMEGKNMLTKFGKELRKIRIENDEILKDMADKLNVTAAYLSAVENGNRKVPDAWVNTIVTKYNLSDEKLMIKTEPKTDFWQRTYYVCQTACFDKRHSLRRYK